MLYWRNLMAIDLAGIFRARVTSHFRYEFSDEIYIYIHIYIYIYIYYHFSYFYVFYFLYFLHFFIFEKKKKEKEKQSVLPACWMCAKKTIDGAWEAQSKRCQFLVKCEGADRSTSNSRGERGIIRAGSQSLAIGCEGFFNGLEMMTWDLMGLFPDRNIPLRAFPDILWLNKSACVCVCVGERERGGEEG